jgi:pimeloyl-ACP methyl ester carboxylesterase
MNIYFGLKSFRIRSLFMMAAFFLFPFSAYSDENRLPIYHEHQDLTYYLDQNNQSHPVKTIKDWEIRKKHILAHMQKVMGPVPHPENKIPLDVKILEEVKQEKFVRKKISYHTDSKKQRVNAYLFLPVNSDEETNGKVPGILCLHQTTKPGKMEPAGLAGNPHLHYALELAKRGYVTLAPDYPSFGEYEYDFKPDKGYISGTMKAIYDNIRAIDLLASLEEVDAEKIGCIGHSLGGHNTMFTAAFEKRIKVMVSCCGFTRFHKYYSGNLKGWTSSRYMPLIRTRYHNNADEVPFDFPEIVASFAPRPFFTCSPIRDSNFEVTGVKDVMNSAQPIYDLYRCSENLKAVYPDSTHDFPDKSREAAYLFIDLHLSSSNR